MGKQSFIQTGGTNIAPDVCDTNRTYKYNTGGIEPQCEVRQEQVKRCCVQARHLTKQKLEIGCNTEDRVYPSKPQNKPHTLISQALMAL